MAMKSISNLRVIILLILSILLLIVSSVLLSFDTEIAFSYKSGFYEAPLQLQISCNVEGAAIYYTTDGSVPDTTDHLYTGALPLSYTTDVPNRLSARTDIVPDGAYPPDENVMKAHVIRAVAITPWGGRSQVLNGTFFIGYDREMEFGEVPIFSLMIEDEYLFDYETGIYVNGKTYDDWNAGLIESLYPWILPANYTNRGEAWERPITVEYLPFGDAPGFVQDMGLRIKGGYSRTFEQKSLRLTARAEYGAKALDYPVFPDNVRLDGKGYVEKYKSIVLRNGGNDFHYAAIRDPLIQRLSTGMRFITQSSLPCIVFINGEYWGGYALTEHYSDNFIENNYGIDNSNVVTYKSFLIEDGTEEDIVLYNDMHDFIISHDMSDESNYQTASMMLDMGSYADFCALQLYICNTDSIFEWNNYEMWRVRVPYVDDGLFNDGKWRMMLYDTESSLGIYGKTEMYLEDFLSPVLSFDVSQKEEEGYLDPREIFCALWRNDHFRREVILSMCDVRNIYFEKTRAVAIFEELRAAYEPQLRDTIERFPSQLRIMEENEDIESFIGREMEQIIHFLNLRYDYFPKVLQESLNLSEPCTVSVSSSDCMKGEILLNHHQIDLEHGFVGKYFFEYPINLTAIPSENARFVGWKIDGNIISTSLSIELPVEDGLNVTAVFE